MQLPLLRTSRLVLRPLQPSDEEAIFQLRSNTAVNKYIDRPLPADKSEATAFISKISKAVDEGNSYYWAIMLKEEAALTGTICIWNISSDNTSAEIGYELLPDYQGKGIMAEAAAAMLDFAFQSAGFTSLEAYTHKENLASEKLLSKLGFRLNTEKKDPENEDLVIFSITK